MKQLEGINEAAMNEALGLCNPDTVVWSFVKGLGRETPLDVVNGIYIATRIMGFTFPYSFDNYDPAGVACPVIRRILAFSSQPSATNDRALMVGEELSKYAPKDLGLMAQYLFARGVHLYPWQTQRAKQLLSNDFGVTLPTGPTKPNNIRRRLDEK